MSIEISPKSFFEQPSVADMRLIACPGAEELTGLIDKHLVRWAKDAGIDKETFIISCDCPRFQSGDAKGLVKESVRGDDIFIVVDPGNYSVTYKLFDNVNHMSPDDHFANLKRLIQAVAGKAHRVSVIMPSLYGGRQHRRVVRESLDCAVALQELERMGVTPKQLTPEKRLQVIAALESGGLFLLKGAVKSAAASLHCSPASVYRYITQIKNSDSGQI